MRLRMRHEKLKKQRSAQKHKQKQRLRRRQRLKPRQKQRRQQKQRRRQRLKLKTNQKSKTDLRISRVDLTTVHRIPLQMQEMAQDLRASRITISKDLLPRVIRSPQVIDLLQSPRLTEMQIRARDLPLTDLRAALTRITRVALVRLHSRSPLVSRIKSPRHRVASDVTRMKAIRTLPRSISSPLQLFVSRQPRAKRV